MNIVYQVGASTANLGSWNSTSPKVPWSTNMTDTPWIYDSPYSEYLDSMDNFAEAATRRGKVFHDEANQPVYAALQGLATAVHVSGR